MPVASASDDGAGGLGDRGAPHGSRAARLGGLVRLVHPFPSLLDALAVAAIAVIAGGTLPRVVALGAAMLLLQLAIGSANDWFDAPADAVANPAKPIPAGLVARPIAARIAVASAALGLVLAAACGVATLAVAAAGLAAGLAYDLRLKGTPWSWVPYAVGIPLLPVFAWVGAAGSLPAAFAALVPVAMVAGAGLAVANALADLERDRIAGARTVATRLGPVLARRVSAVLQATVAAAALGTAAAFGGAPAGIALAAVGASVVAIGVALGWGPSATARQRAWELQGIGLAVLAAGWIASLAAAGRLAG